MTKVVLSGQNTAGQPSGYAALDGASGLLVPAYVEATQQASTPAAPATGKTRLYVDASGLLQLLPPSGSSRRLTTDWGSGTTLPSGVGERRGDVYGHTGLGCLMVYNGTAWRQEDVAPVATAAARATLATTYATALHQGFRVQQTDKGYLYEWDGAAWRFIRAGTGDGPVAIYGTTAEITSWPGGQVFGGTPTVQANTDTAMFTTTAGTTTAAGNRIVVNEAGRYDINLVLGLEYLPLGTNYYANLVLILGGTAVTGKAAYWNGKVLAGTAAVNSQWIDLSASIELWLPSGADVRIQTAANPQAGEAVRYSTISLERIG